MSARGWHFIVDDLGMEYRPNGLAQAVRPGWLEVERRCFDSRTVWDGLLEKHAKFSDYLREQGQ